MYPSKAFQEMIKADFITGLVLMGLSVYVLVESWFMDRLGHLNVHPLSVPGIVPAFFASVLFVFGLVLTVRSVLKGGYRLGTGDLARALAEPGNRRLVITASLTVAYAGILIGSVPFWLATGAFVFLFVLLFEFKKIQPPGERLRVVLVAAALAVSTTAIVSLVFERIFLVKLP